MTAFRAGTVFHVTRAASVQFLQPIFFRLIRVREDVREDWITYHGWVWLDGYQLNTKGEAVERRSIFVQQSGLRVMRPVAGGDRPQPPRRAAISPTSRRG